MRLLGKRVQLKALAATLLMSWPASAEQPPPKASDRGEASTPGTNTRPEPLRRPRRQMDTAGESAREGRRPRKPVERARPRPRVEGTQTLVVPPPTWGGCALKKKPRLTEALLALTNPGQLLSLELWGDTHEYRPFQRVIYYMRSPKPVYVTLFWVGPAGDIYVPFSNLQIPAHRNVSVDPYSIIVPPLGREQWVAVATLEPVPLPCGASTVTLLQMVETMRAMPHAVGRWQVNSSTQGAKPRGQK